MKSKGDRLPDGLYVGSLTSDEILGPYEVPEAAFIRRHRELVKDAGCQHPADYGKNDDGSFMGGWCDNCYRAAREAVSAGEPHELIWGVPEPTPEESRQTMDRILTYQWQRTLEELGVTD